jgi:hypothetical protein
MKDQQAGKYPGDELSFFIDKKKSWFWSGQRQIQQNGSQKLTNHRYNQNSSHQPGELGRCVLQIGVKNKLKFVIATSRIK